MYLNIFLKDTIVGQIDPPLVLLRMFCPPCAVEGKRQEKCIICFITQININTE